MSYSEALKTLLEQYGDCNLLLPAASEAQLNPFYKYHVEVVPVDMSETSGDIFKVGQTKVSGQNGKDIYMDVYALTKPLLNKLAMAAGVQFNSKGTYGERVDKYTYRAHAEGTITRADGTPRSETDQKEICLRDDEEKFQIEFTEKAEKGIEDWKQAKAAAEIFKGRWVDAVDKNGRPRINSNGYPVKLYIIDESDRQRYVDRSVRVNMQLLKKTWAEKAMTGAKMRVIRALLGIKGTYTLDELRRNFAVPSVVFSPDYNDPAIKQAMLAHALGSVTNMFGISQAPVQRIDFDTEAPSYEMEADIQNPAYATERVQDDAEDYQQPEPPQYLPEPEPEPVQTAPVRHEPQGAVTSPPQRRQNTQIASGYTCADCGASINKNVYDYSVRVYGRALCMSCQKKARANR